MREQMAMPSVIDSEANDDGKEATEQRASWEVDRMRTVDHESGAALGAQVRRHLAAPHLPPPAPPGPLLQSAAAAALFAAVEIGQRGSPPGLRARPATAEVPPAG